MTRYWCMHFEANTIFQRFGSSNKAVQKYRHVVILSSSTTGCYQLSKSESLVKGMQTAKFIPRIACHLRIPFLIILFTCTQGISTT